MESTINLNQNSVECLKHVEDVGGTLVMNICTGAEAYVPWGTMRWGEFLAASSLSFVLLFGILGAIILVLRLK